MHIYNQSQTIFIYYKQLNLFKIHNLLQTTSSQVRYIETTPQGAHGDCIPSCDPGNGLGADDPTCDAGHPPT